MRIKLNASFKLCPLPTTFRVRLKGIYHLETPDFNRGTMHNPQLPSIIFLKHHIYTPKCDVLNR